MCHSSITLLDFHLSCATPGFGEITLWYRYAVQNRWQVVQLMVTEA